jgi:hypothetical protein
MNRDSEEPCLRVACLRQSRHSKLDTLILRSSGSSCRSSWDNISAIVHCGEERMAHKLACAANDAGRYAAMAMAEVSIVEVYMLLNSCDRASI